MLEVDKSTWNKIEEACAKYGYSDPEIRYEPTNHSGLDTYILYAYPGDGPMAVAIREPEIVRLVNNVVGPSLRQTKRREWATMVTLGISLLILIIALLINREAVVASQTRYPGFRGVSPALQYAFRLAAYIVFFLLLISVSGRTAMKHLRRKNPYWRREVISTLACVNMILFAFLLSSMIS